METAQFDYDLPEELIAQRPPETRGSSRLMILERVKQEISHHRFADFPEFLKAGDVLVINDSRVVPALVFGRKKSGGGLKILFLEEAPNGALCLITGKKIGAGTSIILPGDLEGEVIQRSGDAFLLFIPLPEGLSAYLDRYGKTPLPPYIKRRREGDRTVDGGDADLDDRERYQTVYACHPGSVAAPTAGLHFDSDSLAEIKRLGVEVVRITLHVGIGTFLPIRSETLEAHVMHRERFEVSEAAARSLMDARQSERRVIAVGTTTTRAIESAVDESGNVVPMSGETSLFITPGFRFRAVDAMLTNFHLPRSTLLALVSAFGGRELILAAYREAVKERYRFYSYGDAMFIV